MGYTSRFTGHVTVTPPLNPHEVNYLTRFATVAHTQRTEGPYALDPTGQRSDASASTVTADRPERLPGFRGVWCQRVPSADGTAIAWDEEEKFYDADKWMAYLIDTFLKPGAALVGELAHPRPGRVYPQELAHFTFDHAVNGLIEAQGEEEDDRQRLEVRDNTVYVIRQRAEPEYGDISLLHPDDWGAERWALFAARTRHNVTFRVRDGRLEEVDPAEGLGFDPVRPAP